MTRHASIADQLRAVLAYTQRPIGVTDDEIEEPIAPIQTNWTVAAANDNNPEDVEGLHVERLWEITPSVEEMHRSWSTAIYDERRSPIDGDFDRNTAGQVVRIGRLKFSDGMQTEKAFKMSIDGGLVQFDARLPTGAMIGTDDKEKAQRGGDADPTEMTASNRYFAEMLNTKPARHVTGRRNRQKGKSYTSTESKAMLAEAWANTDATKVTYTKFPTGLPCASARPSESFVGMKKATCSGGGSQAWEDIMTAMVNREIWATSIANLPKADLDVIETATKARNMAEVGFSLGYGGKTAERRGRRALIAANDNLMAAIKEASA